MGRPKKNIEVTEPVTSTPSLVEDLIDGDIVDRNEFDEEGCENGKGDENE